MVFPSFLLSIIFSLIDYGRKLKVFLETLTVALSGQGKYYIIDVSSQPIRSYLGTNPIFLVILSGMIKQQSSFHPVVILYEWGYLGEDFLGEARAEFCLFRLLSLNLLLL